MNERIKELAEQAGMGYGNLTTGNGDNWIVAGKPEELERFAKLIVKECAGIYSKIDNGNLHMGTDDYLKALHETFRS